MAHEKKIGDGAEQAASAAQTAPVPPRLFQAQPAPALPPPLPRAAPELSNDEAPADGGRRVARRRPAGPVRRTIAANDDAPTIGGLIFALEQKPTNQPFTYAAIFSVVWALVGLTFAGLSISTEIGKGTALSSVLASPITFLTLAAITLPIGVIWFLALLAWRAEELRLRSSTMTEVAVRLAEPDRMAEQSIASLGQNVRRQVSFMNDAISRALGRAGELEALVHSEVAALERSYEENEKRIRGLIQELSGERHALLNTSERVAVTLRTLGSEVPGLIDKLSDQQIKLGEIIAGAGQNLSALDTALTQSVGQLETSLGSRTQTLQHVLEGFTSRIDVSFGERTEQMQNVLEGYTGALANALATRTEDMQAVFEEYTRALDTTLANRAEALDVQLVQRTATLDAAFSNRLQLFDDSIKRSAVAIDGAVSERSFALNQALERHVITFREAMARQGTEIDESLMQGINAVRRTSETITKQSLKAIEGLADQSEALKNVSDTLLGQVQVTLGRFKNQSHQMMQAAEAIETANEKIDNRLQNRHAEMSRTLEKISGSADQFGAVIGQYSSTIEGTLSEAERRARIAADELRSGAEMRSQMATAEIERFKNQTASVGDRALEDMRSKFSAASGEVQQQMGSLSDLVTGATQDVRNRSALAAAELAREQARLRAQIDSMPQVTRESAETMRRSLQEQLAALEQLNQFTNRGAQMRDVTPPMGAHIAPPPAQFPMGQPGSDGQQALSSLSALQQVEQAGHRARPVGAPEASGWSFGDLLARASQEEDALAARQMAGGAAAPFSLNVSVIARALDPAAADAIWTRLRSGQRGIMARSIYSPEGRVAFDEINRRVATDADLQGTIGRYLADFESILKDAEARDPSGHLVHSHLISDTGRVYLFLAHASGRLA